MASSKAAFHWDDPLLLSAQQSDDERMVRDAAHAYSQERLAPRVPEAFRHEKWMSRFLVVGDNQHLCE